MISSWQSITVHHIAGWTPGADLTRNCLAHLPQASVVKQEHRFNTFMTLVSNVGPKYGDAGASFRRSSGCCHVHALEHQQSGVVPLMTSSWPVGLCADCFLIPSHSAAGQEVASRAQRINCV